MDIVARSAMSFSMSWANSSGNRWPMTAFSSLRLFTVFWRCQRALSHCASVTSVQPGQRRQAGSVILRSRGYLKGCSPAPTLPAGFQVGLAFVVLITDEFYNGCRLGATARQLNEVGARSNRG